jgi:DNA-binding response OmpR family regulator
MKVLLVEDDQDLAALVSATLSQHNCVVDIAPDGELGLGLVEQWDYDVIVLDVGLPKLDGIAVCRRLRQRGCGTPILMLTAQASTEDIVTGLDAGADDYVTKPFDPQQVLARLRALQRRQGNAVSDNALTWGNLVFDTVLTHVTYGGQELNLSPKEYALLELFLRHPKRIFSRADVIDRLWTIDATPSDATVTNLVKDLRRKLKAHGVPYDPVETIHGLGYRLKAPPNGAAEPTLKPGLPRPELPLADAPPTTGAEPPTLDTIAQRFQARLQGRMADLYAVEAALQQDQLTAELQAQARATAHKLTGSLGTFGYGQGSDLMRSIEHLLMAPFPLGPKQQQRFLDLLTTVKGVLKKPPGFNAVAALEHGQQQILIIDADRVFTRDLETLAADLPFTVTVASDHATAHHRLAENPPDVVLLNLGATAPQAETLAFLADLNTDFPDLPVLVLADQDTLGNRAAITAYGVQRFIPKPIQPMELLALVTQVLAETRPNTATVMIVDDDPMTLKYLSGVLLDQGIQTTCLLHPSQFWELAKVMKPALLLLDLEMPDYSGIELCKTVRQDVHYRDLPILMITAHTDAASTQSALAAGADDVLPKPITEILLLTRINHYLSRRPIAR